jgi:hypothetical protein
VFPIIKVDQNQSEDIEYLGTKRKFWFTSDGKRYLFKAEERGTGEDWAEKVVCEAAALLGLPHVHYDLAHEVEGGNRIQPGVVCPSFVPRPLVLVLGNQLLVWRDPAYPADEQRKYGVQEYTIEAVGKVVSLLDLPSAEWMSNCPPGLASALSIFIGYTMLDAWVANQDRHHQNWGAVWDGENLRLAPTFDHGAALARNLSDVERKDRLTTRDKNRDIEHFAARARSGFYPPREGKRTLLASDVFQHFAMLDDTAARIWLGKLADVRQADLEAILREIPPQRMSPVTQEFTLKLLMINQRRLLEFFQP